MKHLFSTLLLFTFVINGYSQNTLAKTYGDQINTDDLKDYLSIIASDALEGRYTGTRGQKMAAAFIANHFQQIGLKPPVNNTYYQAFDILLTSPTEVYVKVDGQRYDHLSSIYFSGSVETEGEIQSDILFAGQGREEDVKQLDVKGKSVLVYLPAFSYLGAIRPNVSSLRDKGAKAVFIVSGTPGDYVLTLERFQSYMETANGHFSLKDPERKGVFLIDQPVAEKMFKTTFAKLEAAAKEDVSKSPLKKIKPGKVVYKTAMKTKWIPTENVLGYLEGTDKKDELVVITAHYDHAGKKDGTEGDQIYNGADDDGSGTAAVMELARIFAKAKAEGHGPRRSILFMAFTAEEITLLGSKHYTENPVFPLDKTVVDLNIDMIGRKDPQHKDSAPYVYIIGADKLSTELHTLSDTMNKAYTDLIFDYTYNAEDHPDRFYYRSDQWNFANKNIPIIFYFNGVHEDYHQASDEISKIEFDLMMKRTQLVFYTAWDIANRDDRLVVDKK
jgi:Peptidase family M28